MVEPITSTDKLKNAVKSVKVLIKSAEQIKKEQAAVKPIPLGKK
jgi:hypothetical protein